MAWFSKQSKLVKIILLLIPGVNWLVELYVRWSTWKKKGGDIRLIVSLVVTLFGLVFGWVDLVWVLLFDKLLLQ
jgi:ABC-type nickel/cobalt efflux system permease component RcnA